MYLNVNSWLSGYYAIRNDNNEKIRFVQWADDKTGDFETLKVDEYEQPIFNKTTQKFETELHKGDIHFTKEGSYFEILIGLFQRIILEIKKVIQIEKYLRRQ